MKKQPIMWHKQCLQNQFKSLERQIVDVDRAKKLLDKAVNDYRFYSAQIELAEKEGKDGFDSQKYGYKRLLEV